MSNEEYELLQEIVEELERFFCYVNDHWDDYFNSSEIDNPEEFPYDLMKREGKK